MGLLVIPVQASKWNVPAGSAKTTVVFNWPIRGALLVRLL